MGKSQRDKGTRYERNTVLAFKCMGVDAKRVPLSGASSFTGNHDVSINLLGRELRAECKTGQQVPKTPYAWLAEHDLLFMHRDRADTLVVMSWHTWVDIVKAIK